MAVSRIRRAVLTIALIASVILTVYGASVVVAMESPPPDVETKVVQDPDSDEYHAMAHVKGQNASAGYWMSAGTFQNRSAAETALQDVRDDARDGPGPRERLVGLLTPFSGAFALIAYEHLKRGGGDE